MDNIACVNRTCGFDQQNMTFTLSHGFMLHTFGNDKHLTRTKSYLSIAKVNVQFTLEDQKYFVGFRVIMPDELSLHLNHLEMILIHLSNDLRRPML